MRVPTAGRAGRLLCGAAVAAAAYLCALSPVASAADAGSVRFAKAADSAFDVFTKSPTAAQQTFMRDHYWRMRTYAPYFDSRLSWFPGAWVYKNAYAIYPSKDAALISAHPEWILKDAGGSRLYIQFGCANGTCPQYAADIGNPAFRAHWIATARTVMAAGYKGLFIDDVNMYRRVSNGNGVATAPRDPRTGGELT
jgi:putative glycosyl hydrolase-like family 15 (GHL15) protein